MVPSTELLASLALNDLAGLGALRFRSLINAYGSAQAAVAAFATWPQLPGFGPDDEPQRDLASAMARAVADAEMADRESVSILLAHAGPYPRLLRVMANPPPVLYVKGDDICGTDRAIALVGSRRPSHYGEKMARLLSEEFAAVGVTTVSGLARGVDTRVHTSTLEAGGRTWAVVGSGLLMTYPPENRELANRIAARGAVISEFPMALKPHPSNFPRRNRIIAGLSAATVVVEGGETSGALITARLAAEEGREVFAVPGPATSPLSRAPHLLLRQGAAFAESGEDVLVELGWALATERCAAEGADSDGDPILSVLTDEPLSRESFLQRTGLDAATASSRLVELELKGLIRSLPGGKLVRA